MSIFEAGFVFWGYLAIYIVLTLAYFGWMAALNRRESQRSRDHSENG
ncbi:hypothetical protein [Jiangella muralis]|nr:hypothetical protein [Jiangella muralis]